jgi:hypothetical protein
MGEYVAEITCPRGSRADAETACLDALRFGLATENLHATGSPRLTWYKISSEEITAGELAPLILRAGDWHLRVVVDVAEDVPV